MPDTPLVTITDPGDERGPPDVLGSGGERPGLPRRIKAGLLAVVLAAGGSVLAGRAFTQDRAQERVRLAAFAEADALHTIAELGGVSSADRGSGRLSVEVNLIGDGSKERDQLTRLVLEAPGLTAVAEQPYPFVAGRQTQLATATVNCDAAKAGRIPDRADVALTLVPRSKVPHAVRLPIPPAQIREAALDACDLPDPDRLPVVEVYGRDGRLSFFLEAAPRQKGFRLESLSLAGFDLALRRRSLPFALPPNTGYFFGLTARVTDCGAAQGSDLQVRVTFSASGRSQTIDAQPNVSQPQPGSVPAQQVLRELLTKAC